MSSTKSSGGHVHSRLAESATSESNVRQVHLPTSKKPTTSRDAKKNKSHKEATFDYYQRDRVDDDEDEDDDDDKQRSRSSSSTNCSTTDSSSSSHSRLASGNTQSSASIEQPRQSIYQQAFDSHGSSTTTKYSSDNGGGIRLGSDSDDDPHLQSPSTRKNLFSSAKHSLLANPSSSTSHLLHNDTMPTVLVSCPRAERVASSRSMQLDGTSTNRPSPYGGRTSTLRKSCTELAFTSTAASRLAHQLSYELVHAGPTDEQNVRANQVPRFKQPAHAGMYALLLSLVRVSTEPSTHRQLSHTLVFYLFEIDVEHRRTRREKKRTNERTKREILYDAQVHRISHITPPSIFSFFLLSLSRRERRPTNRPRVVAFAFFLLSYLIFQYNYHSSNLGLVIIIIICALPSSREPSRTRRKSTCAAKSIMLRSLSRRRTSFLCPIYSAHGLGRR